MNSYPNVSRPYGFRLKDAEPNVIFRWTQKN
jgi:hypothetical protein